MEIVLGIFIVFILIGTFKGIRVVNQGSNVMVERLGKYHATLDQQSKNTLLTKPVNKENGVFVY